MIKKNTKAIFIDGEYKGEYDWKGGIPLSTNEIMTVNLKDKILKYKLIKKEIVCDDNGEDQIVNVTYEFSLTPNQTF
ncbi:MAG: hypothetical protein OQK82_02340 [Candidatus Pacearchaeota archaeon]|nr:hypothetical protein [Candidatus Pacearchaeota archaeon]